MENGDRESEDDRLEPITLKKSEEIYVNSSEDNEYHPIEVVMAVMVNGQTMG